MIETIGQFLVPTVGGAIYDVTGGYDLLLIVFIGSLGASMALFTLAHIIPNPRIPSPRVAVEGAVRLVARRAVQHVAPREREAVGD